MEWKMFEQSVAGSLKNVFIRFRSLFLGTIPLLLRLLLLFPLLLLLLERYSCCRALLETPPPGAAKGAALNWMSAPGLACGADVS